MSAVGTGRGLPSDKSEVGNAREAVSGQHSGTIKRTDPRDQTRRVS